MADIRELIILSPKTLDTKPETAFSAFAANVRMAARRAVVQSAEVPLLRSLYRGFYRLHFWLAIQIARRFPGTRALYLTSGIASEKMNIGISDVDVALYGDWPETKQFRLMKIFGLLTVLSPLFDRNSLASIATVEDLQVLCATDMTIALTYAKGARQWKLLFGEPILHLIPDIAPQRFAACVSMDIRRWWSTLARTSFETGVLSRDTIFRNSICFKTIAETLRAERMLATGALDCTSRTLLLEQEFARTADPTVAMVLASASRRHLPSSPDPREPTLHWFLTHAARFHAGLAVQPALDLSTPVRITGTFSELAIAPATSAHAMRLVTLAREEWPSLRAAYLAPCAATISPDCLCLLLETAPGDLPTLAQLRRLCAVHTAADAVLPQRLAFFLLQPDAAYLLDATRSLELFHYTLLPAANPDVYHALTHHENTLYGDPQPLPAALGWSPFAQELALEELNARRGAYARFGLTARSDMENLRNLWRFLQLLLIERSHAAGEVLIASTLPAIRRAIAETHPQNAADLLTLEHAFRSTLEAKPAPPSAEISALIARTHAAVTALS